MIHLIKKFFHIVDIQTVGLDDEAEPVDCLRNSVVDNDIVVVVRLLQLLAGDGKAPCTSISNITSMPWARFCSTGALGVP